MNDGPPPPTGLAETLRRAARRVPDHVALRCGESQMTYAQLDAGVDAAAVALTASGVGQCDRVALMLGNGPVFVETTYAIWRLGGVAVPINTALTAPEIAAQVTDCRASAMVLGKSFATTVATLRGTLPDLDTVFVADDDKVVHPDSGMRSWADALSAAAGTERPRTDVRLEHLALLAYSSGTSKGPRAAMLTHGQLLANHRQMTNGGLGAEPSDLVFTALPLFHSYPLNVAMAIPLAAGATLELAKVWDPAGSLQLVADRRVTIVVGAPPTYAAWLGTPAAGTDLSHVRLATSGGAPLAPAILSGCASELGLDIREGYGLVEAGPVVSSSATLDASVPGCVGVPLPETDVRVMGDGREVEPGDPGRLQVRGPSVFTGYWDAPEATAEVLDEHGWLDTGDIALLDDGLLFIVDRASDVIVVSGFNVYPSEVEAALVSHPAIVQAAAIGVNHPYTGHTVTAFVVVGEGSVVTADELTDHVSTRLARFKRPSTIQFVADIPTLPTGRVRRRLLRGE